MPVCLAYLLFMENGKDLTMWNVFTLDPLTGAWDLNQSYEDFSEAKEALLELRSEGFKAQLKKDGG